MIEAETNQRNETVGIVNPMGFPMLFKDNGEGLKPEPIGLPLDISIANIAEVSVPVAAALLLVGCGEVPLVERAGFVDDPQYGFSFNYIGTPRPGNTPEFIEILNNIPGEAVMSVQVTQDHGSLQDHLKNYPANSEGGTITETPLNVDGHEALSVSETVACGLNGTNGKTVTDELLVKGNQGEIIEFNVFNNCETLAQNPMADSSVWFTQVQESITFTP